MPSVGAAGSNGGVALPVFRLGGLLSEVTDALIESQLTMLLTIVKTTVKNPVSKARFRSVFLKLYRAIKVAFADDEDFA